MKRRVFLKGSLASSAIAVAVGAGLLSPRAVMAAWSKAAFEAKNVRDAMNGIAGTDQSVTSDSVVIKAPEIAENGAVVPITVFVYGAAESISIIVENNPTPLAANFILGPTAKSTVSTRIKMGKTSNVIALVKADGKLLSASKEVKVTIGGCGG